MVLFPTESGLQTEEKVLLLAYSHLTALLTIFRYFKRFLQTFQLTLLVNLRWLVQCSLCLG